MGQLRRNTDTQNAWTERSRQAQRERAKGQPRTPLPKSNPARKKKRQAEAFGPQAEECRHLPCCACFPGFYTADFLALEQRQRHRVSDPHHTITRPAGKDYDTVPLCMPPFPGDPPQPGRAGHHRACSGVNSSEKQVERSTGRGEGFFRYVAKLLAAELEGNIADVETGGHR